ncbi:hydrogenase maturation protein HypF [Actinopolymorpha cephalotaxi]|uniref:Hydrogenase maturation protein HypF n=1 Tax=Actinopolymorpha cephalotaxi TaxID=504797 RepID=A0A1I2VMT2_9ACTN|nr:Sua5/YciO/YrdC/YwlC family protein [Actinopolymorpha cephalotaxi]NYH83321.1 hydrogenase maturation protein HypF [Actinopolymorpha cephalotaxi]SFG88816.1 hydrogenase maturation protein HypF [Actinopolymorpha cephalotaxi]
MSGAVTRPVPDSELPARQAQRVLVAGSVVGVGLRRHLSQVAGECGLDGTARTVRDQVVVEVAGPPAALAEFVHRVSTQAPRPARVSLVDVVELEGMTPHPGTGFRVLFDDVDPPMAAGLDGTSRAGHTTGHTYGHVSGTTHEGRPPSATEPSGAEPSGAEPSGEPSPWADRGICPACLRELFDPADRRYRYPFLSCRLCGPRQSLLDELPPYGRPSAFGEGPDDCLPGLPGLPGFAPCAACTAEREDPAGRRHHAPATACPECGPHLTWRTSRADGDDGSGWGDRGGRLWAGGTSGDRRSDAEALAAAVETVAAGGVVAVKGPGGYQLVCDATVPRAVARLRSRTHRWTRPLTVLAPDLSVARAVADLGTAEVDLLVSPSRPVVLAPLRRSRLPIAAGVSAGSDHVGLALPATPLQALLVHDLDRPLVVTGAHPAEEPVVVDDALVPARLAGLADGFLGHDLPIRTRTRSSVHWVVRGRPAVLRRGRGVVPTAVPLPFAARQPVLAVGAQLSHTCTLAGDSRAYVGEQLGDLTSPAKLDAFEQELNRLVPLVGGTPAAVAHDLHPGYLASQYARRWPQDRRIAVQHHHAHVAACAAEHGVTGTFLGVAYDGPGLGDDGTLWGGEILVADLRGYHRAGRFGRAPLPGGELAARSPIRTALGYLLAGERLGGAPIDPDLLGARTERLSARELETVRRMVTGGVNSPPASSAARLVDAVAGLLGLREDAAYEGEAATVLETAARGRREEELPWRIVTADGVRVYDPVVTLAAVLSGMADGVSVGRLAAAFHATLVAVTVALCVDAGHEAGVRTVCLAGSTFTNRLLLGGVVDGLEREGFDVFVPERVPTDDSGVSYGQAAVAAARMAAG